MPVISTLDFSIHFNVYSSPVKPVCQCGGMGRIYDTDHRGEFEKE